MGGRDLWVIPYEINLEIVKQILDAFWLKKFTHRLTLLLNSHISNFRLMSEVALDINASTPSVVGVVVPILLSLTHRGTDHYLFIHS